jgi:hypothetical protein
MRQELRNACYSRKTKTDSTKNKFSSVSSNEKRRELEKFRNQR